jgi:hypothetical protein
MQIMISWLKGGDLKDEDEWWEIAKRAAQGWLLTGIPMANTTFDALRSGRDRDILEIPGASQVDRWIQTAHVVSGDWDKMTKKDKNKAMWGIFDMVSDISRVPVSRVVRQAVKGKTAREKLFGPRRKRPKK